MQWLFEAYTNIPDWMKNPAAQDVVDGLRKGSEVTPLPTPPAELTAPGPSGPGVR